MVRVITEEMFWKVKRYARWHTNKRTADNFGIHLSTVINIVGCRNYDLYRELVRSEHQPTKYSLAEDVIKLHDIVFNTGGEYHKPLTAKTAITQLIYKLENEKK